MDYAMEELLPVVGKLTEMYTGHDSTSVTYETAEQLMGAVLYCLREAEAGYGSRKEEGLTASSRVDLWSVYQMGYQKVLEKTARAKIVYERILENFCSYGNHACEDTIIRGMPEFFVNYDARFRPQDHLLTLDYPLLNPTGRRRGIDAVYFYLSCIFLEQRFLSRFPREYVVSVLSRYHADYEDIILNISSVVMRNVLIHMMMGKPLSDHTAAPGEMTEFGEAVRKMEKEELEHRIDLLLTRLTKEHGDDKRLLAYLSCDRRDFIAELKNAAENGCVERLMVY